MVITIQGLRGDLFLLHVWLPFTHKTGGGNRREEKLEGVKGKGNSFLLSPLDKEHTQRIHCAIENEKTIQKVTTTVWEKERHATDFEAFQFEGNGVRCN